MEELEVAKKYLEYGVSPEIVAQPDVVEIDSERESLTSAEQQKILEVSPNSMRKWTYRSPKGKPLVQNPEWKTMSVDSLDFEDDPFRWIREEMD